MVPFPSVIAPPVWLFMSACTANESIDRPLHQAHVIRLQKSGACGVFPLKIFHGSAKFFIIIDVWGLHPECRGKRLPV